MSTINALKNIENWLQEINTYVKSKNGYPIYDLMKNSSQPGYLSASGLVFYTEDEDKLTEFKNLNDVRQNMDALKEFIRHNPENFTEYSKVVNEIGTMDNQEALAFGHLISEKNRKEAFKYGYYGAAFIEQDNQYLIFGKKGYEVSQLIKSDLNNIDNFNNLQAVLRRLYQNGEIKPECIFSGKAYERLKSTIENVPFFQMDKKSRNLFEVLSSFKQSVQPQMEIVYNYHDSQPEFEISNPGMKNLIIKTRDKQYELASEEKGVMQYKNIADLLKEINQTIASTDVEKFISRLKM
jgi:hypothetical protein